jgi:hypothetical protein
MAMNTLLRRIGGFIRRAAPVLRRVARVAAPILGAVAGVALVAERQAKTRGMVKEIELKRGEKEVGDEG